MKKIEHRRCNVTRKPASDTSWGISLPKFALHELRLAAMTPLMLLMIVLLCAPSVVRQGHPSLNPDRLAQAVTIYRDRYGVAHVFGATDASTVFGFAYAQAEDNFWRVEENFISALGRTA